MTERKDPKNKKKAGRPKERVADKVDLRLVTVLAEKGFTDLDLADALNVEERTVNRYKKDPAFLSALKAGKDFADSRVERSLYERACGFRHEDKVATLNRFFPPDTTAAIFWLCNRRREEWRQRVEHTGNNGGPIEYVSHIPRNRPPKKPAPPPVPPVAGATA